MISVQNRLPEPGKENRVSITPDNGSAVEGVLAYADDATQEGTFWNRKTAQLLQGDIREYPVRDGYTINAGDVVNVDCEVISGMTFGDLNVGSIVQISEDGTLVDYLVVHHGKPSSIYDDSCDGTWLLRKDCIENRVWDSGKVNKYAESEIHSWLNSTMFGKYNSNIQTSIKQVKIPYCVGNSSSTVNSGTTGLSCSVFLLGGYEIGWTTSISSISGLPVDGSVLSYFQGTSFVDSKRIAYMDGVKKFWYLRSPKTNNATSAFSITSAGGDSSFNVDAEFAIRPCIIVDSSAYADTPVYDEPTVYHDVVPQDNVENMIYNNSVTASDIVKLNDTYSVVCFVISNGVHVMLVDNQTGKVVGSTPSVYSGSASSVSLARLDDSHFVVGWIQSGDFYTKIGTVSGTTITFGSQVEPITYTGMGNGLVVSLGSDSFLSVGCNTASNNTLHTSISTVSGNTITRGTTYNLGPMTTRNYLSACRLPDDTSGNKRVCICFSDTGDGNKGKAVIATIDSSNAVTFGSLLTFSSYSTLYTSCGILGNDIIVAYTADADGQKLFVCSIPLGDNDIMGVSETFTVGTATAIFFSLNVLSGKIVVLYTNTNGISIILDRNDGSFALKSSFDINDSAIPYVSSSVISNNKILSVYADNGNSNYGTTTVLEVLGNQIAGSFLDNSSDAIALADGTGGQSIPVGFGGYCECPEVTEGKTITSDGVNAFSPLGGWLKIFSVAEQSMYPKFFSGLYTGNGSTMTINVGKKPYILFCHQTGGNGNTIISSVVGGTINFRGSYLDTAPTVTFTDTGVKISKEFSNKSYKYKYIILA